MRCNRATPSCSQCVRAGVECAGYRDPKSLTIRNESIEVARKAQLKRQELWESRESRKCRSKSTLISQSSPSVARQLSPPIRDQATCLAQQNYLDKWLWPSVLDLSLADNAAALSSITALGLAVLANTKVGPTLIMAAREEYTVALASTNKALQDLFLSKSDLTLMAVMFLGMFEVVTCTGLNSILQWRKHIEGAVKLLEWRGEEQLRNPRGLHLFRQNYTSPILSQLSLQASDLEDGLSQFSDRLANVNIHLSRLCADMEQGAIPDHRARIGVAMALDMELASWAASMPLSLMYNTISITATNSQKTSTTRGAYGNFYHTYEDLYSSNLWNHWRGTRFIVQEIILQNIDYLNQGGRVHDDHLNSFEYTNVVKHSETILKDLVADICASVPYYLSVTDDLAAADVNRHENKPLAAGYSLLWPLFLVAKCRLSPPDLKKWVILSLEKIGHEIGINQASAMAQLLLHGIGVQTWQADK
ncbi:hypothetical protein B7463_g5409, partial [Scytalidium lignicola]